MTAVSLDATAPVAAPTTADALFEALVAAIVRGDHEPGERLPAERELARQLGASRPTLREVLRRLAEWNLVRAKRGSGIVVRERSEWSIEVLPAYLRHAPERGDVDAPELATVVADLLALRRALMIEIVRLVAPRLPADGTRAARASLERACREATDPERFARADLGILRALVEAAGFLPGMWMLNRLATVYLDLVRSLAGAIAPPEGYRDAHERLLGALDRNAAEPAARELATYLEAHDRELLGRLGLSPEHLP